jgi:hypothetical protein
VKSEYYLICVEVHGSKVYPTRVGTRSGLALEGLENWDVKKAIWVGLVWRARFTILAYVSNPLSLQCGLEISIKIRAGDKPGGFILSRKVRFC